MACWRARAEQAEARAERAEARPAEAEARITELGELAATLSRMPFGQSTEKSRAGGRPADEPGRRDPGDLPGGPAPGGGRRRGQRPGGKGPGRRDYSHLDAREEVHDVPEDQRACSGCGSGLELLDAEVSEQIGWQVKITRIARRRLRCRRRGGCPGPRTVIAPVPPKPTPQGPFTAEFLARLLFDKYVRGLPLQRICRAGRRGPGGCRGHLVGGVEGGRRAAGPAGGRDQGPERRRGPCARRWDELAGVRADRRQGPLPLVVVGVRGRRHGGVRHGSRPLGGRGRGPFRH